jgi:peptidoglycan/LPS O-acetylase OafA/YrhL
MTKAAPKRNHAAWIGPLVALVGLVSYFALAVRVPDLRDSAAINIALVAIGVGIAAWAVLRRRNWKSWLGLGGATVFAALLLGYVFVLSNQLPVSELAPAVGWPAPPLALPDQGGRTVDLAALSDRRVLVVFYRGFW